MDAFVVRKKPNGKLFKNERALLVPLNAASDSDTVDELRLAIEAQGGGIVTDPKHDASVTLVVVASSIAMDVDALTAAQKESILDDSRRRHPHASVVMARWVHDCVKQQARVPLHGYMVINPEGSEQPSRKKRRVEEETDARILPSTKAPPTKLSVPPPHLQRPWKEVNSGSLHFWDAREEAATTTTASVPLKIAAFDMDGTLIVTKSGKRFAQDVHDWKLFHPTDVGLKLRHLVSDGFLLVLLSNQYGVSKGKTSAIEVRTKMRALVAKLNVPMLVLFATQDDEMRKPRVGAWQWLLAELGSDHGSGAVTAAVCDMEASFYCGDAAGRLKIAGRNKDFAATDYKFALNVGIPFLTPEELFLKSTQRIHTRPEMWEIGFDPRKIPTTASTSLDHLPSSTTQEMVVLVGPPASGKSHFAKQFAGYEVICQDDLKTIAKCLAASKRALDAGKSIVVDCTNRDPRNRKEWVALAQQHRVPVRCVVMEVAKPLAMHLNTFRQLTTEKDIPEIAIHTFYKNYVAPQKDEGFAAVSTVEFRIALASMSPEHSRLILSFL